MARDQQLLTTARDYFQFTTKFFDVINVSATHIYHSALESSPLSSIVRKVYYSQRPYPLPKVVAGIPDSWKQSIATLKKSSFYKFFTWSPCSQFIAVSYQEAVEVWDALTLKLFYSPKSIQSGVRFKSGPSYSPDGRSLACSSNIGIIIWDTQTGGEVKTIECDVTKNRSQLMWSQDGKTIINLSETIQQHTYATHIYDAISGSMLSHHTLQSQYWPYIWTHGRYFQIATTSTSDSKSNRINTYEVGSETSEIDSYSFPSGSRLGAFSPATHRISLAVVDSRFNYELHILDIKNSEILLQEKGSHLHGTFSPDGGLFAAFAENLLLVWKYSSNCYSQWRKFQQDPCQIQFSPSSLSILTCGSFIFKTLHLNNSSAAAKELTTESHGQLLDTFSPNGTYVATAYQGESTIAITNLLPQHPLPSQFIDTGLEISGVVLTGNVLLVNGSGKIVAWLLTEEGIVDGIIGNTRADSNDSLWEVSYKALANRWYKLLGSKSEESSDGVLAFSVEDELAAISLNDRTIHVYHIETGEILKSVDSLSTKAIWFNIPEDCDDYHYQLYQHQRSLDGWLKQDALKEQWVKDPEGRHRFWLHGGWKSTESHTIWLHNVSTLRFKSSSGATIVKF